ncbi:hypothetical protein BJ508DRAFT_55031 [Ascobolus immersus RN42]|uniref:Proteasome maturation factor UMP1 n=1 Tax=Ascobolus immersus RN42 TaxID=1160509 RepID=A0A3N4IBT7_ASCIM|nr:hypothetical protein BJ508DRAFT_55031 [Ascobolus immersus RN42]
MRHGLPSNANKLNNAHPLEARLKNWEANQEELKMEGLRRNFGMCEVIRREMEMKFARADYRPTLLGGPSNLHLDILRGKDTTIDWDDVFQGDNFDPPSFHDEMEARLSMKW